MNNKMLRIIFLIWGPLLLVTTVTVIDDVYLFGLEYQVDILPFCGIAALLATIPIFKCHGFRLWVVLSVIIFLFLGQLWFVKYFLVFLGMATVGFVP